MRALCGAIVTAGALIGLGLTAVAYGLRFQTYGPGVLHPSSHELYGIPTLAVILAVLLISTLIGVVIAFIGLAYHHERRYLEQQRQLDTRHTTAHV
jgi:phosphate/sulfate permease